MKNYNPIYLCYCNATGKLPDRDNKAYEFSLWVMEKLREFKKEKNIKLKYTDELAPEQVEEFHDWLKGKYSGGKE